MQIFSMSVLQNVRVFFVVKMHTKIKTLWLFSSSTVKNIQLPINSGSFSSLYWQFLDDYPGLHIHILTSTLQTKFD